MPVPLGHNEFPLVSPIGIRLKFSIIHNFKNITIKLNIRQLVLAFLLLFAVSIQPKQLSAQPDEINFQIFYDALSPYGDWVDYENYGYVWIPDVGPDFAPYSTDGYWVLTDFGWTWVSDYEWGWAPFHYGRWDYDNYYGWLWVPDNEWGPSWVNWRRADGYYGWAPMQPGVSITLGFNSPYNNYNDHWMFVSDRDFERHDLYRYSVDRSRHDILVRNSTIINKVFIDNSRHTTYVTGPSRVDVQRATGRWIRPVAISDHEKPGRDLNDGKLRMYRPQVQKNSGLSHKPAPVRVEKLDNVQPPSARSRSARPQGTDRNYNNNRSTQQRESTPVNNNTERQQQQNGRQPENNRTQPAQQPRQKQEIPENNNGRQQQNGRQPENSRTQPAQQPPQQAPPSKNIEREQQNNNRTQPAQQPQQQHSAPANNNYKQQQQQQNNNRTQPAQHSPQQQTAPANTNYKQQQQQNSKQQQQINTRKQSAPQPVAPAASSPKEQQNSAKPQHQKAGEQQKEQGTEESKKKKQ